MDVVLVSGSLPQNLPWKPPSPQRLYPLDFTKSQKTGRLTNSGQQTVQSESETNAIAQIKKLFQNHEVEIVAVTPKK
jgi:hypothetical protein